MQRLALILLWAFLACYLASSVSTGTAVKFFDLPMTIMVGICGVTSALSVGFHSYIDGIVKDLPKRSEAKDQTKLESAIDALGALRAEIISNSLLVVSLLTAYAVLLGVRQFLGLEDQGSKVSWIIVSLQFSCLVAVVSCAVIQLSGFQRAIRLRDVVAKNR